jgi:hypothetical protein
MSSIAIIDRAEALRHAGQSLGLASVSGDGMAIGRTLLAQALRRAVYNTAPCDAQTARSVVQEALSPLTDDLEALKEQIDDTLHDLVAMGDIFEMPADDGKGHVVLRPAPPAFVARSDGSFIILGVAGDEITPTFESVVLHHTSGLRSTRPRNTEICRSELLDLGLIELAERLWLQAPATCSATEHVAAWMARLPVEIQPEKIDDFEILQPPSQSSFYRGRWSPLHVKHVGVFVARRRQRYGAKLWCLAEVKDGSVLRLTDIHARDARIRDCDEAWRLQSAMDATSGAPQRVSVTSNGQISLLSFSAPLPAWAARRLAFIGEPALAPRSLLAFEISTRSADSELSWLREKLWLACGNDGEIV